MKLVIFSDVHASIEALEAMDRAERSYDALLFAGDMLDWGFDAHRVIGWFRERADILTAVKGNHDRALLNYLDTTYRPETDGKETTYGMVNLKEMTPEDVAFVRAIPEEATVSFDGCTYFMKHSYDENKPDEVGRRLMDFSAQPFFEEYWQEKVGLNVPNRRIIFGHSHECWLYQVRGGSLFMNPGSLHYRKHADVIESGGDYLTVIDGAITMRHLEFLKTDLEERIAATGFSEDVRATARRIEASRLKENGNDGTKRE